jgi:hypothetical protein
VLDTLSGAAQAARDSEIERPRTIMVDQLSSVDIPRKETTTGTTAIGMVTCPYESFHFTTHRVHRLCSLVIFLIAMQYSIA